MSAHDSNMHGVDQNEGHTSVCMFRRRNNGTGFEEVWYWKSTLEVVVGIKFWPTLVFLNVKLSRT
jgi:hypothetical protein